MYIYHSGVMLLSCVIMLFCRLSRIHSLEQWLACSSVQFLLYFLNKHFTRDWLSLHCIGSGFWSYCYRVGDHRSIVTLLKTIDLGASLLSRLQNLLVFCLNQTYISNRCTTGQSNHSVCKNLARSYFRKFSLAKSHFYSQDNNTAVSGVFHGIAVFRHVGNC